MSFNMLLASGTGPNITKKCDPYRYQKVRTVPTTVGDYNKNNALRNISGGGDDGLCIICAISAFISASLHPLMKNLRINL